MFIAFDYIIFYIENALMNFYNMLKKLILSTFKFLNMAVVMHVNDELMMTSI